MNKNSDVIIIGGGINGVSTAFQLAKQGASVTLLEKNFIASGPTGYSCAIIRHHYSNEVTANMALKSLQVWQNFDEAVGGECGYTKTGFLIGVGLKDVDGLKANIALQQSVGIDTRFVSSEEMRELVPHLDPAGLGGAAYEPEGGYCDPATVANSFAKAAQKLGAKVFTGVTVTGILSKGEHVTGVETSEGFIPAGVVLVAAGPWSAALLHPLELEPPITAARVKMGVYRRPEDFQGHPVHGDFVIQNYLRPESGNLTLVGSISPDEAKDVVANPDSFNEKVEMDILAEYAENAAIRFSSQCITATRFSHAMKVADCVACSKHTRKTFSSWRLPRPPSSTTSICPRTTSERSSGFQNVTVDLRRRVDVFG